jgi:hypothetical protein
MTGSALVARMYSVSSWVLIVLLAFQAVAHLVLTVLFYTGAHGQGYGFFLDFRWPSWLITVLDVGAATSLWWVYRRGRDQPTVGFVLTASLCLHRWPHGLVDRRSRPVVERPGRGDHASAECGRDGTELPSEFVELVDAVNSQNGQSLRPAPCIPPARLTLTRRHRRSTCVCPSGLPLAGDLRVEQGPLGLNPELRTPPLPAAHVRAGTGAEHSPGTTSSASPTLHTTSCLAARDLVSHHLNSALRTETDNGFDTVIVPGPRTSEGTCYGTRPRRPQHRSHGSGVSSGEGSAAQPVSDARVGESPRRSRSSVGSSEGVSDLSETVTAVA